MLVRNCSGGIVFSGDRVLLLQNEKHEWIFPKGVIRTDDFPEDVATKRVLVEAGVKARIISSAGRTNYEFYSISRQRPVCNKIVLLAIGSAGAMQWFAPIQPLLAVAAVFALAWALHVRLRGERSCLLPVAAP